MADEQQPVSEDGATRTEPPRYMAGGLGGLAGAFARAITQAARNKTMFGLKEHVVARQFRRQIASPVVAAFDQAREAYEAATRKYEGASPGVMYDDIDPETLERYIRNAEHAWFIFLLLAWAGAAIFAIGSTRSGLYAINVMLGAAGASSYALIMMLRACCDVWMMREGKLRRLREVLSRLDEMWCPLRPEHPLNKLSRYAIAPAIVITALSAFPLMFLGK